MAEARLRQFDAAMAEDVAALIDEAFAEHRELCPLNLRWPMPPHETIEELADALAGPATRAEASFVAVHDDHPVAAAIACREGEDTGWWRVATAPEYRRRGLAARCIEAGESALREMGRPAVATDTVVDSRWQAANALFGALGYRLEDPERRNITMMVEGWVERPVEMAEGYELTTMREADIEGWAECRNLVFGSDAGPEWFREHFMSHPDFDATGWYLVKRGGRIVGISGALAIPDPRDPEHVRGGLIEYVAVLDEHRGHGLGERVVSACLNWLARRGVTQTILITQPFRVPAIRLYEKLGFRTIAAWHRWVKDLGEAATC